VNRYVSVRYMNRDDKKIHIATITIKEKSDIIKLIKLELKKQLNRNAKTINKIDFTI